jgi:GTP cyclohydrolase I
MPVKKEETDIFYTEKKVSHSSHPILIGCDDVFLPLTIKRKDNTCNSSSSRIKILSELNSNTNGSNINKISDFLFENKFSSIEELVKLYIDTFKNELNSTSGSLEVDFDYFLNKKSPVSNKISISRYESSIQIVFDEQTTRFILKTNIPYSSLCPVSKEISDYGAHNQRCMAEISVEILDILEKKTFWVEDIVDLVEKSCSCPVYNSSSLQDEAYQTEMMYENPFFIEEICEKIKNNLQKHINKKNINDFSVILDQKESINSFTFKAKTNFGHLL